MSQIDARLSDAEKRLVPTQIAANSISGTLLQTNSVNADTLADNAVTNRHIESGAVDTSQLADNSVNSDKLADSSVNVATAVVTGTLPIARGGTGLAAISTGVLYSTNGTSISQGTLPVGQGGTGATSFTSGDYLVGAGSGAISSTATIPAADISGALSSANMPFSYSNIVWKIHTGLVNFAVTGSTAVTRSATVTTPSGFTATTPFALAMCSTSDVLIATVTSATTSSFTVNLRHAGDISWGSAQTLNWLLLQWSSTSATG